ncbi:putative esterase [Pedosphaera parvula Ellin514]|uniref:Putative esterase n=2 Tax=Pedosphaera TaxID=1032526 RepID=B9XFI7_PEDPL|nr:putative esterase [Pedosphaera parvula Ellin514]
MVFQKLSNFRINMKFLHRCSLCVYWLLVTLSVGQLPVHAARLEVLKFSSHALKGNPLHDPDTRQVAVFIPSQYSSNEPLPIIYYLPGWGGSSERFIKDAEKWCTFTQKLADEVTPVLLVVVDGRNRWGGSQYINSPAQGNYADYVCDEIVKEVESRFGVTPFKPQRIVAGHSSGGFGALRLGMFRPKLFDGVVALSPDSDFPTSHLRFVQAPAVSNLTLAQVKAFAATDNAQPMPKDGDLRYALGLSAAYAPRGWWHRGEFEWPYDGHGHFREKVWQKWLDNDPLTIVERKHSAFLPRQTVYLEGAALDEYQANVGARKIYEVMKKRSSSCVFYEPPGHHSDHVAERLERGGAWSFGRPVKDIK